MTARLIRRLAALYACDPGDWQNTVMVAVSPQTMANLAVSYLVSRVA